MKKTLFIIHYSLFIIFTPIMLSFLGCTNPTSSATGSLSGTVHLENQQVDHSGIVIGIYELAELDPDIVDANTKWPHIGVKINQHTDFDHRFGNLTKYTQTDANGNFKITDIPTGRYNLVAMKEGFGFRYVYNVTINEGDNALSEQCKMKNEKCKMKDRSKHYSFDSKTNPDRTADIILYPETYINSDITEETVFESSRHYIIEDDIYVFGDLTIEPGAVVRLNPGVKLTIFGDLTAVGEEDNMIWFTSNDLSRRSSDFLFGTKEDTLAIYNRIELTGSLNKQVSYCKFDHAGTGLLNNVNGFSISNCIFRNSLCGFHSEGVDSTFCSNLLCENITNEDGGIYFGSSVDEGNIKNNICSNCVNGIKIYNHSNPEVRNNYVIKCKNLGLDISFYSSPNIQNNVIIDCEIAIFPYYNSSPVIEKNIIFCDYGLKNYVYTLDYPIEFHYNNIKCEIYNIILVYNILYPSASINAVNNYFYTNNETEISNMIFDRNDISGPNPENIGVVNFIPFLTQEYPYAGIQGE